MAAISADISKSGFCLELPMIAHQAGAEIDGYVLHGEKELNFKGRVQWVAAANPQASLWSRMGVRFTWVSPGLRALLSIEEKRGGRR